LFLGILSSITCQGVSGAGENCGGKSRYIYIESAGQSNENIGYKEAEGEEESLVSRAKNKLKQAKDFVYQNPVKVGTVGLAAAATPALAYAGYKIKQHYFGKKNVAPAKDVQTDEENKGAEVNKEVSRSETIEENKDEINNVPVNKENLPGGQGSGEETKSPVETEQGEPSNSNEETEKSKEPDSDIVDSAAKGTDLNPSANTNAEDGNENTDENLKSVFLGVYSDLLVYLVLKLTPQSWGLQKGWYNFWHYKNGRLAHPFKLMLAVLSWVNFVTYLVIFFILFDDMGKKQKNAMGEKPKKDKEDYKTGGKDVFKSLVCILSPNLGARIILSFLNGGNWKQRVFGGVFGPLPAMYFAENNEK
jgi:hypothetical protein